MTFRKALQTSAALAAVVVLGVVAGSAGAADGSDGKIAYMSWTDGQSDIYSMLGDGTGEFNISKDNTIGVRQDSEPAWSPNGNLVAFERHYTTGGTSLMVVNADGTGLHRLLPPAETNRQDTHPAFTPDGSMIVFSSNRDGNFDLYGVKLNGESLIRITKTEAPIQNLEPQVSPTAGRTVVFTRPEISMLGGSSIYKTTIGSTVVTQLTQNYRGAGDRAAVFSPDGLHIAFSSDRAGNNDLYVMKYNGNVLTQLTTKTSDDNHPAWSPSGKSLAFVSDRTGSTEIFALSIATRGVIQLTSDKALKSDPTWQAATPTPMPRGITPTPLPNFGGK